MRTFPVFAFLLLIIATPLAQAQVTTAFTYQGELEQSGSPASGEFDFVFELFDSASGGLALAGPVAVENVLVDGGLFTTGVDFGPNVFGMMDVWLEVRVRESDAAGGFTELLPRQRVTPAPLAQHALNVEIGAVGSAQIIDGGVGAADVDASEIQVRVDGSCPAGTAIGEIDSLGSPACNPVEIPTSTVHWNTGGNGASVNDFLGTTNDTPLEMRVNDQAVMRIADAMDGSGNHAPNVIAGSANNTVAGSMIHGATIGGGGGDPSDTSCGPSGSEPCVNTVQADFATVVGGLGNYASGGLATAMGSGTTASGFVSTAMGFNTTASGASSTAMGRSTTAGGLRSTAMGDGTTASGVSSTAMGGSTTASGSSSTAMGSGTTASGFASTAMGSDTIASGSRSTAMGNDAQAIHDGTFVWADNNFSVFESTGPDQFLIRAGGGVGINTEAPRNQFHVVDDGCCSGFSIENHVAVIENASTSDGDVIALKAGITEPSGSTNFIGFFDVNDDLLGEIQGDGTGGIELVSRGADFAEFMPRADPAAPLPPGTVVGLRAGRVGLDTANASRAMVVSTAPIVTGNKPGKDAQSHHVVVAFIGQVPVRVCGPVQAGDWLVPSGQADGIAIAVRPDAIDAALAHQVIGEALEARSADDNAQVLTLVGLPRERLIRAAVAARDSRIDELEAQVVSLQERADRMQTTTRQNEKLDARLATLEALLLDDRQLAEVAR